MQFIFGFHLHCQRKNEKFGGATKNNALFLFPKIQHYCYSQRKSFRTIVCLNTNATNFIKSMFFQNMKIPYFSRSLNYTFQQKIRICILPCYPRFHDIFKLLFEIFLLTFFSKMTVLSNSAETCLISRFTWNRYLNDMHKCDGLFCATLFKQ